MKSRKKIDSRMSGKPEKKIRYAVVGLGYIAQIAVLPAFKNAKNSELVALISSDAKKLGSLSAKYKVPLTGSYEQFEDVLSEGEIDAVYLTLPNTLHYEFTMRAFKLGKHVLCEKPLATTVEECAEMTQYAETNRLKLMTAYRLHFDPANLEAVKIVHDRKLGEPRIFTSTFTMQVKDRDNIRLKDEMGGGPLFDLGVYCINASRYIFQDEPIEVSAFTASRSDSRFSEVEEMLSAQMRFPGERIASFTVSFGAADSSSYEVIGTEGRLRVDPAFDYAVGLKHHLTIGGKIKVKSFLKHDQFAPELIYFSNCIRHNLKVEPSGREGFADVQVIRALYESARNGRAVRLNMEDKKLRPTKKQQYKVAAVREPTLVRANGPSSPSRS